MLKVLVVEDDQLVRKGLIATMPWAQHGLEVVGEAGNGEKALAFLAAHEVDLLITDLVMPVMSGLELMRTVRSRFPHIFVVVLTFHQDFGMIQEALRLGAIDYIAKTQLDVNCLDAVLEPIVNRISRERKLVGVPAAGAAGAAGAADLAGSAADPADPDRRPYSSFYDGEKAGMPQAAAAASRQDRSETDGARLTEMQERWASLRWVIRDDCFREWLHELKELRIPAHLLESMFYSAQCEWRRIVPKAALSLPVEQVSFSHWTDCLEWISGVRQLMRDKICKSPYAADISESILKAVRYIDSHLNEEIRVDELAGQANMSRSYFSKCFKDMLGMPFMDYLQNARIRYAQILLTQTTHPIYWVAEQCGYPDEKYFSRVFRNLTGMLPSKYRHAHTKVDNEILKG